MRAAIVRSSVFLGVRPGSKFSNWSVDTFLGMHEGKTIDQAIHNTEEAIRTSKKRLATLKKKKQEHLAKLAALRASGDLVMLGGDYGSTDTT